MNKFFITILLCFLFCFTSNASLMELYPLSADYTFNLDMGFGSYTETTNREDKHNTSVMLFTQVPIAVILKHIDISLGVYVPIDDIKRSRPMFSASYYVDNNGFIPGIGVYVGASPYRPWGIELILFRKSF